MKTSAVTLLSASLATTLQATTENLAVKSSPSSKKKDIGLQIYSLRKDMSKAPDNTLREVAKMGYSHIETYGYKDGKFFGRSPKEFKRFVEDLGMRMTSSHTGLNVYLSDESTAWDAVKRNMEDTKETGSKWIVQAGYPGGKYTKMDQVKKLADTFNRIGELAKSHGLKFGYHNHRTEFRAIENQIPYQKYLELTDPKLVSFQMDIGHVANEMADYLTYLINYPGRFGCMHIRDTNIFTKIATEMGDGNVRLKEVFDLFEHAGVEDYYVEQEEYNYAPTTSVKMCYDYLAEADFVKW